jgi:hypothetical protein
MHARRLGDYSRILPAYEHAGKRYHLNMTGEIVGPQASDDNRELDQIERTWDQIKRIFLLGNSYYWIAGITDHAISEYSTILEKISHYDDAL